MNQYFTIFGIQPELSLAELLSVEPNLKNLRFAGSKAIVFESEDWDSSAMMERLGGTVKLGQIVLDTTLNALDVEQVTKLISAQSDQNKKIQFGWTVFGTKQNQKLENFPLKIKKVLKILGFPSRWVTGENSQELSPAAVAKCKLTEKPNADVCVFAIKDRVLIGFTSNVQDADAWSLRDYGRPCRDDANGMLPPKLARMMVNLSQAKDKAVIIDPFCGSGTILMEAGLTVEANKIIGSDISEKQIEDTKKNLEWLEEKNILNKKTISKVEVFVADARKISETIKPESVDAIVTEGWLGPALHGHESPAQIKKNTEQIQALWADSLKELKKILKSQGKAVIIVPEFKTASLATKVDITRTLHELGFEVLKPAEQWGVSSLSYARPNQFITRHILVLGVK